MQRCGLQPDSLDHGGVLVVPGLDPLLPLVSGHLVLVQDSVQETGVRVSSGSGSQMGVPYH